MTTTITTPSLPPADTLHAAARALRTARAERRPIAPVSTTFGLAGIDAAYAVAELNTQAALAEGRRVLGRKVGLTSRAVSRCSAPVARSFPMFTPRLTGGQVRLPTSLPTSKSGRVVALNRRLQCT